MVIKRETLPRFHQNLTKLPAPIKRVMTLENDDKTYNAEETLAACEKETIPFVFDYHHHMANLCETALEDLLPRIFQTWKHVTPHPEDAYFLTQKRKGIPLPC